MSATHSSSSMFARPSAAIDQWSPAAPVTNELDGAFASGELCIVYQPIIDLATRRVHSVEALARLVGDDGVMGAEELLRRAGHLGLVPGLDRDMVSRAIGSVAEVRHRLGIDDLVISVNLSPLTLSDGGYVEHVCSQLERHGVDPSAITIEVTETSELEPGSVSQLLDLDRLGIKVGVDDFGTGHSSLSRLQQFPVAFLKVDRSFVAALTDDHLSKAIVRASIHLADELGVMAIIEGVEHRDQERAVTAMGARFVQGFLYSGPLRIDDLEGGIRPR